MNKNRLLILAKLLEMATKKKSRPKFGFNMHVLRGRAAPDVPDLTGHECNTVACIAGWTCAAFASRGPSFTADDRATPILALSAEEASRLFYPWGHFDASPIQAARVLRHAAKTGVIDWSVVDRVSN